MGPLLEQLKRRNVLRVAAGYAVVGWLVIQVADTVFPNLGVPSWLTTMTIVIVIIGFPISIIVSWIYEWTPEGVMTEKEADEAGYTSPSRLGRQIDIVIIVLLVISVGWLVYDKEKLPPVAENSIAVLPFVNMSSDNEQEYFSDGITEEILNMLAGVKLLKVVGRTSSFAFKERQDDFRLIGQTLSVEYILEGSVRRSGNTVRVSVQLIKADDGFQLWSETFDRELDDIFAIQHEIATTILQQLKTQLLEGEIERLTIQSTDSEVYELYLLAKQHIRERTQPMRELAAELLDEAIEKDAEYAPAWAQRGIVEMHRSYYRDTPKEIADSRGLRFIKYALDLDPQSAEAWAALGLYYSNQRPMNHDAAVQALTTSLSINPSLVDASNWLFQILRITGEMRAALALVLDITERDLLYTPGFTNAISMLNFFGLQDEAQALIDKYRMYDPRNSLLIEVEAKQHWFAGHAAEAFRLAEQAMQPAPRSGFIHVTYSDSLEMTQQVEQAVKQSLRAWRVNALDYLGRRDEAFDLVETIQGANGIGRQFVLLNRSGRSQELVDFFEERWSNIDSYAVDYPVRGQADFIMVDIAVAYQRVGNKERYERALTYVEEWVSKLSDAGLDNFYFRQGRAEYLALAGNYEAALDELEVAVEQGFMTYPDLATKHAVFTPMRGWPRLAAIEAAMVENINRERTELGLDPIDPDAGDW